jgi:hypothetical protein
MKVHLLSFWISSPPALRRERNFLHSREEILRSDEFEAYARMALISSEGVRNLGCLWTEKKEKNGNLGGNPYSQCIQILCYWKRPFPRNWI